MHQTYTKIEASLSKEEIPRLPTGQLPPLWMRTSFIRDGHHGREIDRVMVPIEVFGEVALFMRACYDGIPLSLRLPIRLCFRSSAYIQGSNAPAYQGPFFRYS